MLGTISITRSMCVTRGAKKAFEEPKSQMGHRQVAMPPSLVIELREHHERMEQLRGPLDDNTLLFAWEDGRPMLPDSVTDAFKRIARRLGLGWHPATRPAAQSRDPDAGARHPPEGGERAAGPL